jgi:hypothetical protein
MKMKQICIWFGFCKHDWFLWNLRKYGVAGHNRQWIQDLALGENGDFWVTGGYICRCWAPSNLVFFSQDKISTGTSTYIHVQTCSLSPLVWTTTS